MVIIGVMMVFITPVHGRNGLICSSLSAAGLHMQITCMRLFLWHDDVIKWKHFPRYWPFVRGIHRSPVNSPHKGQWRGALMFSLMCTWINARVNTRKAGDLRRHRAHYDVIVMHFVAWMEHHVNQLSCTFHLELFMGQDLDPVEPRFSEKT